MDFIENLELEHKWIGTAHSTLAQIAKSALSDKNLDHLATLLEVFDTYVLGLHFLKEEAVLFPEVLKLGLDQKGGAPLWGLRRPNADVALRSRPHQTR